MLAPVFTGDASVQRLVPGLVLAMAVGIPLAGFVFVLDGVLLGAGDARYLAWTGIVDVAVYLPLLGWAALSGSPVALWFAFGLGYIGARAVTLGLRALRWRWVPRSSAPDGTRS